MTISKKKFYLMITICLFTVGIICSLIIYLNRTTKSDEEVAALVNGEPLTLGEVTRIMNLRRAFVINTYSIYGVEYGDGFWNTKYGDETPIKMLKRTALDEAVRIKIQLLLAEQKGIIQDASYSALLDEMDAENNRRTNNTENNIPVYGLLKMDENSFIDYYMSNIVIELKSILSKDELKAGEDELLSYYESVKDTMFAKEDTILFDRISVSYAGSNTKAIIVESKETTKEAMETLRQKLMSGMDVLLSIDETLSEYEGIKINYSKEELNNESASHYAKYYTGVYESLNELSINKVSDIIDIGMHSEFMMVIVRDRQDGGYMPFKDCRDNVAFLYMNDKYDAYINMLIDMAEIEITKSVYDRIMPDDVF